MGIETVGVDAISIDVAEGEQIELFLSISASCIDREENGPCDDRAQEAHNDHHLEEAHKEVAVDRLVVQDVLILEVFEVCYPSKKAPLWSWRLSLLSQVIEVRPRRIHSAEGLAENDECCDEGTGEDRCRH